MMAGLEDEEAGDGGGGGGCGRKREREGQEELQPAEAGNRKLR